MTAANEALQATRSSARRTYDAKGKLIKTTKHKSK